MIPCLVCGNVPRAIFPGDGDQLHDIPSRATLFTTVGNYGSTVFDEITGRYLHIVICDQCMIKASRAERIAIVTPIPPLKPEDTSELWLWDYEGEPE